MQIMRHNNKQLDGLVKLKWFASVLSQRVMFKHYIDRTVYVLSHDTYDISKCFIYASKF